MFSLPYYFTSTLFGVGYIVIMFVKPNSACPDASCGLHCLTTPLSQGTEVFFQTIRKTEFIKESIRFENISALPVN